MSTMVTVAVAAPNHLPVDVQLQGLAQSEGNSVWVDREVTRLKVGEAKVFCVYQGQRITVTEVPSSS